MRGVARDQLHVPLVQIQADRGGEPSLGALALEPPRARAASEGRPHESAPAAPSRRPPREKRRRLELEVGALGPAIGRQGGAHAGQGARDRMRRALAQAEGVGGARIADAVAEMEHHEGALGLGEGSHRAGGVLAARQRDRTAAATSAAWPSGSGSGSPPPQGARRA